MDTYYAGAGIVQKTNYALIQTQSRRASLSATDINIVIPTSTPNVVVVKSYNKPLLESQGTIKTKAQFDEQYPLFLRDYISEQDFLVRCSSATQTLRIVSSIITAVATWV